MLERAQLQLITLKKSTFTANVMFNLKFVFDDSIPTANVDGISMRINPTFFVGLSAPERVFVLAHETWHVCYEHITRFADLGESADFKVFNEACDHVINLMLSEKGYSVPQWTLCDSNYKHMYEEQVYYLLLNDKQKQDPNFQPDFTPAPNGSTPEDTAAREKLKDIIDDIIVKAHIANEAERGGKKGAEDIPDVIAKRIYDITHPKVPWQDTLRQYCFEKQKVDSSFAKPNRRFLQQGMILPSPYGDAMGKITIAIDVSGSVSDDDFNAFMSEIYDIRDSLNPTQLEIIQWHHDIAKITLLEQGDSLEDVTYDESGGTDVHPMLRHCIENPPELLVVFTDGYYTPFNDPDSITFPSIWTIYDNESYESNCGQTIHFQPSSRVN